MLKRLEAEAREPARSPPKSSVSGSAVTYLSPNGRRLAYSVWRESDDRIDGAAAGSDIYIMEAKG
jgi:hypothetical protein